MFVFIKAIRIVYSEINAAKMFVVEKVELIFVPMFVI